MHTLLCFIQHNPIQLCNLKPLVQTKHVSGNLFNGGPGPGTPRAGTPRAGTPRTRLERLLRERELRKNRSFLLNEEGSEFVSDLFFNDGENWSVLDEEENLGRAAAANGFMDNIERPEGWPSKQRLLVVANRLPVSAIRRGEDSWQLEISVGGLVSALLGM